MITGIPKIYARKAIEVYPYDDFTSEDRFLEGDLVEINNYDHICCGRLGGDIYVVDGRSIKYYIGRIVDVTDDSLVLDVSERYKSRTVVVPFDQIGNIRIYEKDKKNG